MSSAREWIPAKSRMDFENFDRVEVPDLLVFFLSKDTFLPRWTVYRGQYVNLQECYDYTSSGFKACLEAVGISALL